MKLLIVGLPDTANNEIIPAAVAAMVSVLGIKDLDIEAKVLNSEDIAPRLRAHKPKASKFLTAVNGVLKAAPTDIVDSIAFRSWFYTKVLDNTIERPILQIIAMGPTCANDRQVLNEAQLLSLPEYAKVALDMLA